MTTPREIATRFDVVHSKILYAIMSRNIAPARVLGGYRMFDAKGVKRVRGALDEIAKKRRVGPQ